MGRNGRGGEGLNRSPIIFAADYAHVNIEASRTVNDITVRPRNEYLITSDNII